jgi:hypothetical protein
MLHPPPRFQSEYGFPSYPSKRELAPFGSAADGDFAVHSAWNVARQDLNCPLDNSTSGGTWGRKECQLAMVDRWLRPPQLGGGWRNSSASVWERMLYAGQVVQALCVKAQTEHLRRGRDTAAQTMGVRYPPRALLRLFTCAAPCCEDSFFAS